VNPIASNREREEFLRQTISQRTGTAAAVLRLEGARGAARFLAFGCVAAARAEAGRARAGRSRGIRAAGAAAAGRAGERSSRRAR